MQGDEPLMTGRKKSAQFKQTPHNANSLCIQTMKQTMHGKAFSHAMLCISVTFKPIPNSFSSIPYSMHTYPICYYPLKRSARGSFALLQNRTEITPYCVCTETLSGVVFVPVQKLSGIVSTRPKVQNKFPCRDKQNHKEFWWKVFIQIAALRIFPKPSNFNQIACIAILFALARFEQRDSGNCCAYTAHLNASFKTRITVAQSKDSQNIYMKDFEEPYWKWCN